MYQQQLASAIARRLYGFTREDVTQVLEVMADIWYEELARSGGYIHLARLGKFYVEQQSIPAAGAVRATLQQKTGKDVPTQLCRLYFRFQPSDLLKQSVIERSMDHE